MKKVAGIGIFEKGLYPASITLEGKTTQTKAYKDWVNLCSFCGSESYLTRSPSYKGKTLHPNWIKFQEFAEWHSKHYQEGWYLSTVGSDLIGPETSYFLPKEVMEFVSPRKKPLIVGPKHVKLCMTIHGVGCLFGKYQNIPDAMLVYSGLFQNESERLAKVYNLNERVCRYLNHLSVAVPPVRFL